MIYEYMKNEDKSIEVRLAVLEQNVAYILKSLDRIDSALLDLKYGQKK